MKITLKQRTFDNVNKTYLDKGTVIDVDKKRAERCIANGWACAFEEEKKEVIEDKKLEATNVKKAVKKSTKK